MKNPFNIKDINLNNIRFIESKNEDNIMLRYFLNNKQNKFFIQTPELVISSIVKADDMTILTFNLECLHASKLDSFTNFLVQLDRHIISNARNNKNWFKTNNIKFKGLIRQDVLNNNKPYLKLKVKTTSLYKLKVSFDRQSEKGTFDDLRTNLKVKMILDINGLWINDNGFGIYLKPYLIDIRENYELILNNSSEEDIMDTEIVEVSESTSIMHLHTENKNIEMNNFENKNIKDLLKDLSDSDSECNSIDQLNNSDNSTSNSIDQLNNLDINTDNSTSNSIDQLNNLDINTDTSNDNELVNSDNSNENLESLQVNIENTSHVNN